MLPVWRITVAKWAIAMYALNFVAICIVPECKPALFHKIVFILGFFSLKAGIWPKNTRRPHLDLVLFAIATLSLLASALMALSS